MRKPRLLPLSAALFLAAAAVAEAGGGMYMGGGGGGRGAYGGGGGGFGGGMSAGRGSAASGPMTSAPSASYGASRGATAGRGGNWNGGNGNWNGRHGGHGGHNGHGHWGWSGYYPYYGYGWWGWPYYWGAGIGFAATWPYWSGTWVDPYYGYYGAPATTYYYGAPSGTIIYRSDQPNATPVPQGPAVRLYCPATNAFYPNVTECSEQWLRVLPNDGAAPAPQQQPIPQSMPQSVPQSQAPAARPAYPNGSRGYDVNASNANPRYVRASMTMAASMPVSASAAMPDANATDAPLASTRARKIPAPRAVLPGQSPPGTIVAELRAD